MRCPQCGVELQVVGKYAVCPEHGPVTSSQGPAPVPEGDLDRLVLERFPFPIAYGLQKALASENAAVGVDHVFYTYAAILRLVALTLLSQFLRSQAQNPQVARVVQHLRSPTLESWFSVMNTLAKHLFATPGGQPDLASLPFSSGGPLCPGLVMAARGWKRATLDGLPLHTTIRNLRNERAHGAPWDDAECSARMKVLRPLLGAALKHFAPLAEVQVVRRAPSCQGMVRLVGVKDFFDVEPVADPRIEELFDESDTVLLGPEGAVLPLYPLFLGAEPVAEGYQEPLLVFDGFTRKTVVYLGVRRRAERQETLARYHDLLAAKHIDPRFTLAELAPWQVSEWARETSLGAIDNLRGVKYFPEFYQERCAQGGPGAEEEDATDEDAQGVDDTVTRWLEEGRESAMILAAEAGAGKTSLLCRLAERLLGEGQQRRPTSTAPDCVLLLLGGAIRGGGAGRLFARIRDGLGLSDDAQVGGASRFDQLLDAWMAVSVARDMDHEQRRIVLLVDAINEAEEPKALLEEVAELAAMAAAANRKAGRALVRLLVSVRAERIETLLERWEQTSAATFLQHPENFTHFHDRRGKAVPYLTVRRFTLAEAEAAYASAALRLERACPAPWASLVPGTVQLLRHPLMVQLFHRAYAGVEMPPAVEAVETLWDAFLDRTFDAVEGSPGLERAALDLADECLDRGANTLPEELAGEWRARWQLEQGNDPVRIAAGLDPLERLADAGLLRAAEGNVPDWMSDSLAEQVFFRALRRRDPALRAESLEQWLSLPRTPRLDGALIHVAVSIWQAGRAAALTTLLDLERWGARGVLRRTVVRVAPRGPALEVEETAKRFSEALSLLCTACVAIRKKSLIDALKEVLSGSVEDLDDRWGTTAAQRSICPRWLDLAEQLTAQDPDNRRYMRDLSVAYRETGELDARRDPRAAREWYSKSLVGAERLLALEPDNAQYRRDLSILYDHMGQLARRCAPEEAREWYAKALAIDERLAAVEPDNSRYQRALAVSYQRMGDLDRLRDPRQARDWQLKSLAIFQQLASKEPEKQGRQRSLAISYERMGRLDGPRDPQQARQWHLKALLISERLVASAPDNMRYLRDLALSYQRMAGLDRLRDPAKAREWQAQSLAIFERLVAQESDNTEHLRDLAMSYQKLGSFDEKRSPQQVGEWYANALAIRQRLVALQPENAQYQCDLSLSYGRLARWVHQYGDPALERDYLAKYGEAMRRAARLDPGNSNIQYNLGCMCARLGQADEALVALEHAVDLGYGNSHHAADDSDLASLHGHPQFQVLLDRMRSGGSQT